MEMKDESEGVRRYLGGIPFPRLEPEHLVGSAYRPGPLVTGNHLHVR